MNRTEFEETYNVKTNFLEYNGIIRAIQLLLRSNHVRIGSKVPSPFRPSNMDCLFKQNKGCKAFYDVFVAFKKAKQPTNKWQSDFDIDTEDWKAFCLLNFNFTTDTKFRWFQYRINQNILASNRFLAKIN